MTFLEKLDFLMESHKENASTLSKKSGIPYTTIDGFYKKGYNNAKLSTLQKLCDYYNVTLDYLVKEEITDPNHGMTMQAECASSINKLNFICTTLNHEGLEKVIEYASDLASSDKYRGSSSGKSESAGEGSIFKRAQRMMEKMA